MPQISVILPMFDEEDLVARVVAAVEGELLPLGRTFEIICVNDGSTDKTGDRLDTLAAQNPRVVAVHFSRNFGKEAAMSAGLGAATGEAVLVMDADLQHPPDLIPRMLARWDEGYDVVDAVKADRGEEPLLYKLASKSFYALMGQTVGRHLRGSSDYKLLDRQVVDAVLACPERNRFFRGLVAWVGFRVAREPFTVQPRAAGRTHWSPSGLVAYALRSLLAFTAAPLRAVAWAGLAVLALDLALGAQTLWNWWRGVAVSGFTTVILTQGVLGGAMLLAVGTIAMYVAQIYEEQKARPIYVVRKPRPARSVPDAPDGP